MATTAYDWRTAHFLHNAFVHNGMRFCWRVYDRSASVCKVFLSSFMYLLWTPSAPGALSGTLVFQLKGRLLHNGTVLCSRAVYKALFCTTLTWELRENTRNRLKDAKLATRDELRRQGAIDMRRQVIVPIVRVLLPANPDIEGPLEATHTLCVRQRPYKCALPPCPDVRETTDPHNV